MFAFLRPQGNNPLGLRQLPSNVRVIAGNENVAASGKKLNSFEAQTVGKVKSIEHFYAGLPIITT